MLEVTIMNLNEYHAALFILFSLQIISCFQLSASTKKGNPKACGKGGVCYCSEICTVACQTRNLRSVPRDIPSNTKWLDLYENEISSIQKDSFKGLTLMDSLYLGRNQISSIAGNCFRDLSALKFLDLSENNISSIQSNIWEGLSSLEELDMSKNQILSISTDSLRGLFSLESLDLSQNEILLIQNNSFKGLTSLATLRLNRNNLTTLPSRIFEEQSLLGLLMLDENQLSTLPKNVFVGLNSLEILDLQQNNLTTLPDFCFEGLTSLNSLYLQENDISTVPDNVFKELKSLTRLKMLSNQLSKLPIKAFEDMDSLSTLLLNKNFLTSLPSNVFEGLTTLKTLSLSENTLSALPRYIFCDLISLEYLYLKGNDLIALPHHIFKDLRAVRVIDLSKNELSSLPAELFRGLTSLKNLHLNNNKISTIPYNIFRGLTALELLLFSANTLSTLPPTVFSHLRSLEKLRVDTNNLTTLPDDIFEGLTNLRFLDVNENHLSSLPANLFGDLHSLRVLYFSGNALSTLQGKFVEDPSSLTTIDISRNRLSDVPTIFEHLGSLYNVFLMGNKIQVLKVVNFCGLTTASTFVDLSDNNIHQIIPLPVNNSGCNKVETLFLQRNKLKIISQHAFIGFPELRVLSLHGNQICTIEDNAFFNVHLTFLLLFQNNLSSITGDPFGSTKIKQIHLYENRITKIGTQFLAKMSNNTTLYLTCDNLRSLPRNPSHDNLNCVSRSGMPSINIRGNGLMIQEIEANGFKCVTSSEIGESRNYPVSQSNESIGIDFRYTCSPCPAGSYSHDEPPYRCALCSIGGFYQDEVAQTECKQCNVGLYVKRRGGTSPKDCDVCPDGTDKTMHAGYRACFCKKAYARTDRYGPCFPCLQSGLDCDREFLALQPGYMWNWSIPGVNLIEYRKFVENVNITGYPYTENTNYIGNIPRVFKCPVRGNCPNDNDTIAGNCKVGYRGWLCTNCVSNYFSVLNACIPCPSLALLISECCTFVIVCALVCCLLVWKVKQQQTSEHQSRSLFDAVIARIKILLGFYQIMGEMLPSLDDIAWEGSLVIIIKFITFLEINVLKLFVPPKCFDDRFDFTPQLQFIVASIAPLIIALVPLMCYLIRKLYIRVRYSSTVYVSFQSHFQTVKASLSTCVVVIWFIIYPRVCSVIFSLYPMSCKTFSLDQNHTYNIIRLRSDFDTDCTELRAYHIAALFLTPIYVIGYPMLLLYNLRKNHLLALTASAGIDCSSFDNSNDSNVSPLSYNSSTPKWFHFFCENYKTNFWFWEIVELSRKVSQTLLLTVYGWEERITVILTMFISVLFLLLHARYQPMKNSYEHGLQMLSLTVIFLNVVLATNYVPGENDGAIAVLVVLLNTLMLVIITGEFVVVTTIHLMKIKIIAKLFKRRPGDIMQ